jgi:hypothetical protein
MTEQRQKLLDRFDKWLDSKPRKQIISAQCANIAEEYAEEQLRLHVVSQYRELLEAYTQFLWTQHNNLSNAENNEIALNKFIASNCG